MIVFAIVDRFLDIIGLATVLYLTVKATVWAARRWRT